VGVDRIGRRRLHGPGHQPRLRYFVRRRDACSKQPQTVSYRRFAKPEMVCDCRTHLVLCAIAGIGPTPDVTPLRKLLFGTLWRVGVQTLLADAGYDSESNHRFARDGCGMRSVTPSTHGRPCKRPGATLRGRHRRRLQRLRDFRYGQRWQIETVVRMIKCNLGQCVAARSDSMRSKEVMLKVLTHNLMLIAEVLIKLFYRALLTPLIGRPL
jgi:Transposase DDE domain